MVNFVGKVAGPGYNAQSSRFRVWRRGNFLTNNGLWFEKRIGKFVVYNELYGNWRKFRGVAQLG